METFQFILYIVKCITKLVFANDIAGMYISCRKTKRIL